MANIAGQLKEMLQCKVCLEEKVTQKQLPCQHTLCLECLNNLPVSDSKYRCPLCQKDFLIPNGGFECLQDSLLLKQLAGVSQRAPAGIDSAELDPSSGSPGKYQKLIRDAEELLETAEKRVRTYKMKEEAMVKVGEANKRRLLQLKEETVTRAEVKIQAVDDALKLQTAELCTKRDKLQSSASKTKEMMEKLKLSDENGDLEEAKLILQSLKDEMMSLQSADGQGKLKADGQGKLKAGDNVRLRVGDSVRLRVDEDIADEFLNTSYDHMSVGYVKEFADDDQCAVLFASNHPWIGKTSALIRSDVKHELPVVGDNVRIRTSVKEPSDGWGKVKPGDAGVLTVIGREGSSGKISVVVNFGENEWKGYFGEIEKVEAKPLEVGEKVWVSLGVEEPVRGWCGVSHLSVGTLLYSDGTDVMVNFPECTDWKGLVSEVERVRTCILVGDKVRVKKSIKKPTTGWAGITHENIGKVVGINLMPPHGQVAVIDFPNLPMLWKCLISELELVERCVTRGNDQKGDNTRVINMSDIVQRAHQQTMQFMHQHNMFLGNNADTNSSSSDNDDSIETEITGSPSQEQCQTQ